MTLKEKEQQAAIEELRKDLKPGDTVYTILRHVSSSGMTRHIGVMVMRNGEPIFPLYLVAKALDMRTNKTNTGLVVGGCGMDMGFHVVYELSSVLFRGIFHCIGKGCTSNDHSNEPKSNYRQGRLHSDGGYALRQRWL